jgi:bifunctional UDP-N-acetylglucosamine pyrophosphorylase/glucosamine-1-phosphate N-acetyltransferase
MQEHAHTRPAAVIVLAAGQGTRMRSRTPKVLHQIAGRSLIAHAIAAAAGLSPEQLVVVVRHQRDLIAAHVTGTDPSVVIADQDDVPGTGSAVACALRSLDPGLSGTVVVTYGDVPLLTPQTLHDLVRSHQARGSGVTVLTAQVQDPAGYGRVLRDDAGQVTAIVEHRDADDEQRTIREINSGIYAFDAEVLRSGLARLGTGNAQGEMYLTDVLALAREQGSDVHAHVTTDLWQVEGVNDRAQLAALGAELNRRLIRAWMLAGVTVIDPATTWVDAGVRLAPDVTLRPGVQLLGDTTVEAGAVIGPDTTLTDCTVAQDASVVRSHGAGATIGPAVSVGPFSYLRPGTVLEAGGKIGAFVEVKNSVIGQDTKVPHLSYVGDAQIGAGTNVGAATVVVNYDGQAKHRTTIGDHVRIGSDSMLVAPLTIGDGAYTAAGSVITEDVPAGALAVARGRQRTIEGWVERRRPGTPAAAAAKAAADRTATARSAASATDG